jgi:hypothetical protein
VQQQLSEYIFGFAVGAALGRQQLSGDRLIILTPFVGKKPNFPSDIISPASIPRASGKKQLLKGAQKPASRMSKTGLPPGCLDSGAARIPTMSPVKNNTQKERDTHTTDSPMVMHVEREEK